MKIKNLNDFEAVIFDFDGTLVDSLSLWKEVDRKTFEYFNREVPENYENEILHLNFSQIATFTIEKYKLDTTPEFILNFWSECSKNEYCFNIKTKPYVKEFLDMLKKNNIKIALASTNKSELFTPCLKNNGIDSYFDFLLSVNDFNTSKSEPKIYQEASKLMNTPSYKTVVFEDILAPIKTAKAASFQTVGVYDKNNLKDIDSIKNSCDLFINSYKELLD